MIRLTRRQVREVDRRSIEQYQIPGIVLMENAARSLTHVACEMLDDNCVGEVLILCGGGNNGGDGLALARHLHNLGADTTIALVGNPDSFKGDALINWKIAQAMHLTTMSADPQLLMREPPVLVVDAIFGTGLSEPPRDSLDKIVHAIAQLRCPVLAVDIPSGLDCDTGKPLGAAVMRADRTVTFVAEKAGFANPDAQPYLGLITVGDIGCPRELVEEIARSGA